jgi:alpha-L-fucosidase 2
MIKEILNKHLLKFSERPKKTPSDTSVDGPLMGNGDIGVVFTSIGKDQEFILCKNDFWRLENQHQKSCPLPLGKLCLTTYGYMDAKYEVIQNLYNATTTTRLENKNGLLKIECFVAATKNLLFVKLISENTVHLRASLNIYGGRGAVVETDGENGLFWGSRSFTKGVDIPTSTATAIILLGDNDLDCDGSFVVRREKPVTLVLSMESNFAYDSPLEAVKSSFNNLDRIREEHESWWDTYWNLSYVNINEPIIEKQYYRSLYAMASCSRDPEFPPNIFGWVTTDNPLWCGDYHLNYNHQAPFYGLARGNRLEQADPHDAPFLDFMERAAWHCRIIFNHEGGVYPVGIGPKGIETTYNSNLRLDWEKCRIENNGLFFNQRSNGSYGLVNMASRWYCTLDETYGKKIYPFVIQLALFWQNYLTWDNESNTYIIEKDSSHEGSPIDERNSWVSLALCRLTFVLVIDLSKAMEEDNANINVWEKIIKHLSEGSVFEKGSKSVFRLTDNGMDWCDSNTLSIQHIYPGGLIDLDSDSKMIEIALNTLEVLNRWQDFNGSNSIFPAAVRVGYDAEIILNELRVFSEDTYTNGFRKSNPHGIENLSTVPNTINEMLCMGHGDLIRVFPVWPLSKDASFSKIRCKGAFLVSSSVNEGVIKEVSIHSDKGVTCNIYNPWPGRGVKVIRNGMDSEILREETLLLTTSKGEDLVLHPVTK